MGKRLQDEVIVAALMEHGTIKETAQALGIRTDTLYKRMKGERFKELYTAAKADCLKSAAAKLQANTNKAIDTLIDVMESDATAANTKVFCVDKLLHHAVKYTELCDLISRIEVLEDERFK